MTGPVTPPRAGARRGWAIAAALAMLWHGVLLFALRAAPGPVYAAPAPRPPRATLRPLAGGAAGPLGVVRDVWSPVLFSLPNRMGFSRSTDASQRLRPPLTPPAPPARYLAAAAPRPPPGPAVARHGTTAESAAARLRAIAARPGDDPPVLTLPAPSSARLEVRTADGWRPAGPPPVRIDSLPASDRAWSCTVRVVFNTRGEAAHALVEESSAPGEVAAALERALRAWRLPPARPPAEGRVLVRYEPASATAGGTQDP